MAAIRGYADSIHPYRDGHSSERVLDAVDAFVAGGGRNLRPKPRNLWRNLKMRQRFGYWHFRPRAQRLQSSASTIMPSPTMPTPQMALRK
jgi:hypothetical protein